MVDRTRELRIEAGAEKRLAGGYRWVVLTIATLCQIFRALVNHGLPPLLPTLQTSLGLNLTQVGMFMSLVSAGQGLSSVPAGWIVDKVGIRKTLPAGMFFVAISLASLSLIWNFESAIPVLLLVGVASTIVNPATIAAIYMWLPSRIRGTAMGINKSGVTLTAVVSAAVFPTLALRMGWQGVFILMGLVNLLGGIIALVGYRDRPSALEEEDQHRAALTSFWQLLYHPGIMVVIFYLSILSTIQASIETFLMLYLRDTLLLTVIVAGFYLATFQAGGFIGRLAWGIVSDAVFGGTRKGPLLLVGGIGIACLLALSAVPASVPAWLLTAIAFTLGISIMGWHGVYMALMTELAGRNLAASSIGLSVGVMQVARIFLLPLFGYLADISGNYRPLWLAWALVAIVAAIIFALVLEEKPESRLPLIL